MYLESAAGGSQGRRANPTGSRADRKWSVPSQWEPSVHLGAHNTPPLHAWTDPACGGAAPCPPRMQPSPANGVPETNSPPPMGDCSLGTPSSPGAGKDTPAAHPSLAMHGGGVRRVGPQARVHPSCPPPPRAPAGMSVPGRWESSSSRPAPPTRCLEPGAVCATPAVGVDAEELVLGFS